MSLAFKMSNPKVLHLDMNSYFAAMEQQAYPNLRGKPVGIAGKGRGERAVVVGASVEAKRLGVRGPMSTGEAKQICPQLIIIPANYDRYIFTSQRIFGLLEHFSPKVDIFSIDEAFLELVNEMSWQDAELMAGQIKQLISRQIGDWMSCSIGISYGKTLAKLASELEKPDGLVSITPNNFQALAETIPIEKLCGIGFRLRPRLNQMGITKIAELGRADPAQLIQVFGVHTGSWLYRIGQGFDDNQLRSFRDLPQEKSLGHSYTLPRDLTSLTDAKKVLLLLSDRVAGRLRRKNLIAKTVSVYFRFNDKGGWAQQSTQKEYLLDGLAIYRAAESLMWQLPGNRPIRLVSVSVSDLARQQQTTRPLFSQDQAGEKLLKIVDQINHRWGEGAIFRSSLSRIKERIFKLPDGRTQRTYLPTFNPFTKRF